MSFLSGLFGGGSQTQTNTTSYDPYTTALQRGAMQRGQQVLNQGYQGYGGQTVAGMDPRYQQALNQGQQGYGQAASNLGLNQGYLQNMAANPAQFDAATAQQYMNPYNQQVIGALNTQYDQAAQRGQTAIGGMAGAAFGRGGRTGLAMGQMYGDIARNQAQDVAGLQQQGFTDAYGRWMGEQQNRQGLLGNLVNLGYGALGDQTSLGMQGGDYARQIQQAQLDQNQNQWREGRDWSATQLQRAQGALPFMQYGGRTDTQTMQSSSSPFSQLLGAGLSIGGMMMGGPAGAAMASQAGNFGAGGGSTAAFQPRGGGMNWGGGSPWYNQGSGGGFGVQGPVFGQQNPWGGFGVRP